jgi:LuxR family transcriptional regulator, maltose regulon positive regulatory protein
MLLVNRGRLRTCAVVAESGTAVGYVASRSGPDAVTRPDLLALLSAAGRVTLVCAPAGSGKTVLVRSWISEAELEERAAWVSVARGERDSQRFWHSVLDAVRQTNVCSQQVHGVTPSPDLDPASIVERLLDDLSDVHDPLWLVIDDLHELDAPDALEQLELFIGRAPEPLRFVFLTRRDLRLGLHRLRLDGELTEVRAAELQFTPVDSRRLLEASGVQLSDGALEALVERTEGWAAGLRLAALSLARHPDPERFAAEVSGSERTIAEYLLAEVLDRQPEHVSRLLLRTSILERVSGPLADRLTGDSDGERILGELEQAGAFVVSLDPQRSWFRYHHLFADLLALELRRTAPEELRSLHAIAAEWLAEHGFPVEAIRHAQAAEDWQRAAALLADHWFGLYLDGRRMTGHALLAGFPAGATTTNPELAVVAAADELACGSLEQAEQYLAIAMRRSEMVADERRARFELALATLRLTLARAHNDVATVAEEAERLMLPADAPDGVPPGFGQDLRAVALLSLGAAEIWTGRREDAQRHLEQALSLAQRIDRPLLELGALAHIALQTAYASPNLGEEWAMQAVELARKQGWTDEGFVGVAYTVIAAVEVWRGRLDEAAEWIARAERALTTDALPATGLLLHVNVGLLELARGRRAEARSAFQAAKELDAQMTAHSMAPIVRANAFIALISDGETGRVREALAQMDTAERESPGMRGMAALLDLHDGDPDRAIATLGPLLDDAQPVQDLRWTVNGLVVGAIALDAAGDAGGSSRALERALDVAEPDGLVLPFLLFPARELLERHARMHTAHAALIAEILTLLAGKKPAAGQASDGRPLAEPLSESELRVLRYLPTNLQAPEIASELFVSVNTIRTHMRHLYAKLGVHRRTEAVARARELGLLAPGARKR